MKMWKGNKNTTTLGTVYPERDLEFYINKEEDKCTQ